MYNNTIQEVEMKNIVIVIAFSVAATLCQADTKVVWRDAQGRVQGTMTTDRYGKTTYRDSMGRVQATRR